MTVIPKYLRGNVELLQIKNNDITELSLRLHCECGSDAFQLFENCKKKYAVRKDDADKIKQTKDWERNVYNPILKKLKAYSFGTDYQNDYRIIRVYEISGDVEPWDKEKMNKNRKLVAEFNIKKGEVPLSNREIQLLSPEDDNVILKAKCDKCGNEYILFDSRIHGIDTADFPQEKLEDYEFKLKKISNSTKQKIEIKIENPWDFDDIKSNGNPDLTADDYSILFSDIKISAITEDGKKVKIFEQELG